MFEPVPKEFDVPAIERYISSFWDVNEIELKYILRNEDAPQRFSFLDGPITANGPMGVHHAWGRTYKDLWQRYNTMLGKRQRYQNGFDCQGLWVEVEQEKALGFTSKRDIEAYGIANFVRKCKESVFYWAATQTAQSRRLGYFMDWANSYYTLSDQNNYTIWHFLKVCHERGLLYQGTDVMPWCTRCGTGISDAEAAEGYQDLSHTAVYLRFPVVDRPNEYLLVWTTTPWTLTSNVAVAVNPQMTYVKVRQGDDVYYLAKGAMRALKGDQEVLEEMPGSALLGWSYEGPFDELPAEADVRHTVIPWDEVSEDEGTGLVHIAPGCGKEDFALSKEFDLSVVAPLNQDGTYEAGFDWLTGRNVLEVTDDIIENLRSKGILYSSEQYRHRYPTCWRCKTELVFRLVDEWFISMESLREPMMEVVRKVRWIPSFGLERELDWLRNMGDWMISKKRYWGLALPFWICPSRHLTVIGGREELFERALDGIEHLESPHRPWVDDIQIRCEECGDVATRILDVGNPWLDAGIVPYSTLDYSANREYWREWFPARFITESFPGQFRNWFYSMLAMSTVLENTNPFETVLGYATARDQSGREMHKSWGNLIPFDDAAEKAGADVMRWLFVLHNPEFNLNFGWDALDEVKRRLLVLWNTYSFFVTYARLDGWTPSTKVPGSKSRPLMDRWILARLNQVAEEVRAGLDDFNALAPGRSLERFIEELSTWYVRRTRRRFWKAENDSDKHAAYATLYEVLTTLSRLLAPFMPFLAEHLYQNLVRSVDETAVLSVHLTDYPSSVSSWKDDALAEAMDAALQVVALGRAARERANLKVRQPLSQMFVRVPTKKTQDDIELLKDVILDELNVRKLSFAAESDQFIEYSIRPNLPALGPRFGRELPSIRKALENLPPDDVAEAVTSGNSVSVPLDGHTVELTPDDILISASSRGGFASMADHGYLVALDTELTPELLREGYAREVVRRINDWRKEAGFNVEDRIVVTYEASGELSRALEEHKEHVQSETLAVSFAAGPIQGNGFVGQTEFGGQTLQSEIRRVERSQ